MDDNELERLAEGLVGALLIGARLLAVAASVCLIAPDMRMQIQEWAGCALEVALVLRSNATRTAHKTGQGWSTRSEIMTCLGHFAG